jgi:hypothetical protein
VVPFLTGVNIFFFFKVSIPVLVPHIKYVSKHLSPKINCPERVPDKALPSHTEVETRGAIPPFHMH